LQARRWLVEPIGHLRTVETRPICFLISLWVYRKGIYCPLVRDKVKLPSAGVLQARLVRDKSNCMED
ncbi:hypothetical protein, partial [Pradoshia sp.]|uniref:hypothetical protein n=1 Tax=Pradoshia sp. TaxID=2651281 RepID=UPI003F0E6976